MKLYVVSRNFVVVVSLTLCNWSFYMRAYENLMLLRMDIAIHGENTVVI